MTLTAYDNKHRLGIKAHFMLPSALQKTANHYGLHIQKLESGRYSVQASSNNFDINRFCPSFVEHEGNVFDLQNLKHFLGFLHQPIAQSSKDHEARTTLHRFFRFATTGSVEIPSGITKELEKEIAKCHARTEQAMRDEEGWHKEMEIGNKKEAQSAIPLTGIDPKRGFYFVLDDACLTQHRGLHQRALNEQFWKFLNTATNDRYKEKQRIIYLSGTELEKFCITAKQKNLTQIIDRVEFEEAVQSKLQGIQKRSVALLWNSSFKRLTKGPPNQTAQLKELMRCTCALTPIINSQIMRDIWTHYHFTGRHNSPLAKVGKEYGIFMAVLDIYAQQDDVSPAQMEAIAQEFFPLLAFSEKMTKILQTGFTKSQNFNENISKLQAAFHTASITTVSMSSKLMRTDYQDILSTLENSLGEGGSMIGQIFEAGVDTTVDFTMDVVNFIKESPKAAAVFASLATTLYMMNDGGAEAGQIANDAVMIFGETGLEEITINFDALPKESKQVQNWHWDMGVLGLYKHYMYDNAVAGPAQTIMDWIRMGIQAGYEHAGLPINPETAFSKAAKETVEPLANQLFKVNLFQNASHAAFWMYMTSKGFNHGFKGARRIFELLSPITDLGYRSGIKGAELLRLKKRINLSAQLMAFTDGGVSSKPIPYEGNFKVSSLNFPAFCANTGKQCPLQGLVSAARTRVALEETLPENIRETDLTLKIAGLKKNFQISAENLQPTLNALDRFDIVLEHITGQIGIDQPWYQSFLKKCLGAVTEALEDYKMNGNAQKFQTILENNLEDLLAAQIKYSGISPLYAALIGEEPDHKTAENLNRIANIKFGKLKRTDRIALNKRKKGLKAKATILGTVLWGGFVGVTRKIERSMGVIAKKPVIITTAALAAASVALDMAGGGNSFTNMISSGTGSMLSGVITTTTFLLYNFWEDVLGVHVATGAGLLAVGTAAGYAYKRLIKPSASLSLENVQVSTRVDLKKIWNGFKRKPKSINIKQTVENKSSPIENKNIVLLAENNTSQDICQHCPAQEL